MNSVVPEFELGQRCYHCGNPVPRGLDVFAVIGGARRPMCCAGCRAVAEAVVGNGLGEYYETRDALPLSPGAGDDARDLAQYDELAVQQGLVVKAGPLSEVSLLLEGITCGACIWLIEHRVSALPGVVSIAVNYATRRARLRWDHEKLGLSAILRAIADIGYRATPYNAERAESAYRKERNDALKRLFVAGFGMMQVMMYAVPVYLAGPGSMSADIEQLMRLASLLLTLPVVFYAAWPMLAGAARDLKAGRAGMDVPVALGIAVGFIASTAATLRGGGEVYFDSISMFVFLLLSARYFELVARRRATAGIERLTQSGPAVALRLTAYPRSLATETLAAAALAAGDHVLVAPGAAFPADGVIASGSGRVDESLLTGESRAQHKDPGMRAIGGTLNLDNPLVMQVTQAGAATRLSAITRLLERALSEKPRIVELADRVAYWFISLLLLATLVTGAVWLMLDAARAPWVMVAVLVVTCPCALSLATPAALTAATARLAALGVIVTRGHAIETLARADCFVFDKTGTLTDGSMRLVRSAILGTRDADACLVLAAALEQGIDHPVAFALRSALPGQLPLPVPRDQRLLQGQGVEASIDGERLRLGNPQFVAGITGTALPGGLPLPDAAADAAETIVALGSAQGWLAVYVAADGLRDGAAELVGEIKARGARLILLSGDGAAAVARVAAAVGIAEWRARLSPEAKHAAMLDLQREGAIVAMIGDGVNDAPALAMAQVSIAIGAGAPLAQASADMVLLSCDLGALAAAIVAARHAMRVIRQNLAWAVVYNVLALPLAMAGVLTPWLAGIGMAGSSLLVVLNALRIAPRHPANPGAGMNAAGPARVSTGSV